MTKPVQKFDVCVVGGGIVGLTAAALLAKSDLSIALIEPSSLKSATTKKTEYDIRVSAINLASMRIFEYLGIAQSIIDARASAYHKMQIWDANSDANIEFDAALIDAEQLGYILENSLVINHLTSFLKAQENITLLDQTTLETFETHAGGIELDTTAKKMECQLLIGADGQHSKVRTLARLTTDTGTFGQSAMVCRIQPQHAHQQTAYQCFHPTGPIAYLPLADGSMSIVWSCDTEYATTLKALDDTAFAKEVESAMQGRLGSVKILGQRAAFDLAQQHAQTYIAPRIALIGDAAHRTHPLAGLGANLGLQDAAMLSEVVLAAIKQKRPYYTHSTLRKYERARKYQNTLILDAMQGFKTGFASESPMVAGLRSFALNSANQIAPLKRLISDLATGLSGDLPAICKS